MDFPSQPTLRTATGTCCLLQMDHKRHTQPCRAGTQMLAWHLPARLLLGEMAHCFCRGEGGEPSTSAISPPALSHSVHPHPWALSKVAAGVLPQGRLRLYPPCKSDLFNFVGVAVPTLGTRLRSCQHRWDSLWEILCAAWPKSSHWPERQSLIRAAGRGCSALQAAPQGSLCEQTIPAQHFFEDFYNNCDLVCVGEDHTLVETGFPYKESSLDFE